MINQVIISHPDWFRVVNQKSRARHLSWPTQKFEVSVEFTDYCWDKVNNDPLLQEKMWLPAMKLWESMIKELANEVSSRDGFIEAAAERVEKGASTGQKFEAELKSHKTKCKQNVETIFKGYEAKIQNAVEKGWKQYCKDKNDLIKFRIKVVFRNAMRATALTLNTARLIVSSGTDALAWQGTIRTAVAMISDIRKLTMDLDKFEKELQKSLTKLDKELTNHPKLQKGAEIAGALTWALLGNSVKTTVLSTEKSLATYQGRLKSGIMASHNSARSLQKALKELDAGKKKAPERLKKKYAQLETKVNNIITLIGKQSAKLEERKTFSYNASVKLAELKKAQGGKKMRLVAKAMVPVVAVFKSLSGDLAGGVSGMDALATIVTKASDELATEVPKHAADVASAMKNAA